VELADGRIGVFSRPRREDIQQKYGKADLYGGLGDYTISHHAPFHSKPTAFRNTLAIMVCPTMSGCMRSQFIDWAL
jgi:hypothetical protein